MTTDVLFRWVVLKQDVPSSLVKAGDRAVIVDALPATANQSEGYTLEVFKQGETLDVVSVPVAWVTFLPEVWGQTEGLSAAS